MESMNRTEFSDRYPRTSFWPEQSIWAGGAISGLVAGIVMIILAMLLSAARGLSFWLPPKLIAATLLGAGAITGAAGTVIVGVVVHLILSALFGVLFAILAAQITRPLSALGAGLVFGACLWFFMTYISLPIADPVMLSRVAMMPGVWFIVHLAYGCALALTPYFERMTLPKGFMEPQSRQVPAHL